MYYENRKEKRGRGFLVFLAMLVIIGLLVAMNLRLEGMQNLSNNDILVKTVFDILLLKMLRKQ